MTSILRRELLAVAALVGLLAWLSQPAAGYLLAEYDCFSDGGNWGISSLHSYEVYQAETFLCVQSGTLTSVELVLVSDSQSNPGEVPLTVELQSTYSSAYNGILPTGTALATGTIDFDDPQFGGGYLHWVGVSMSPVSLVAGQTYAVAIRTSPATDEAYSWYDKWGAGSTGYAGGRAIIYYTASQFNFLGADWGFRIHGVPEPAVVLLLAVGGLTLLRKRQR